MRHPTNGQKEDDLSRLTGSSNSTASSISSSTTPSHSTSQDNLNNENNENRLSSHTALILRVHHNDNSITQKENIKNSQNHHPSYLPNIIDPLEWQKSRKRKERQDSTSSIDKQERKLVRSNSEEYLPSSDCEVIRRVSSHEDFKKQPLQEQNRNDKGLNTIDENEISITNSKECNNNNNINNNNNNNNNSNKNNFNNNNINKNNNNIKNNNCNDNNNSNQKDGNGEIVNLLRHRLDTSPARSQLRWSPNRNSDDSECENERRRSSERFCKSRIPASGRKSGVVKKGKHVGNTGSRRNTNNGLGADEITYKYDISQLKHERRGFVSKFKMEERNRKVEAADGEQIIDYNDNNLIDLSMQGGEYKNHLLSPTIKEQSQQLTSEAETLPWDRSSQQEQQTPVLCRRFASSQYQIANEDPTLKSAMLATNHFNSMNEQNSQTQYNKNINAEFSTEQKANVLLDVVDEPIRSIRTYNKMDIVKNHESLPPLGMIQTPDERLKYIYKKITALKKRVTQFEDNYEKNYGYKPSQQERTNDKQIKSVLNEINKLRKEKHELKSNPIISKAIKLTGGLDEEKRLIKMKDVLLEIEKKLTEKRTQFNRSENVDQLSSEQLIQEKTAVQHSLLNFESIFGRPSTREERDIARPIYDRYRVIKRMVVKNISLSSNGIGCSELPTILEHEPLNYEPMLTSISTDTSIGSVASSTANDTPTNENIPRDFANKYDSTVPGVDVFESNQSQTLNFEENFHQLKLDELWQHLEKVRDEKKELKKIIRNYEQSFEEQNGRKMLKQDRKLIDETFGQYKEKKAKVRLLQALIKKHMTK